MKRRHFTLIEVLIALALFAGLAVTCVSLMQAVAGSMESQSIRSKHVDSLVTLDRTVKKLFTNMVPFRWRDIDNQAVPHFVGASDFMRFAHLNRVNDLNDGGLRFVELFVDDDGNLIANYQTRPFREGTEINETAYRSILSTAVSSVTFQYASVPEDEQASENIAWFEEWEEDRLDIPLSVMMTVTWQDETSETFMWRPAGNSYYERWGAWRNMERTNQ